MAIRRSRKRFHSVDARDSFSEHQLAAALTSHLADADRQVVVPHLQDDVSEGIGTV